MRLSSLNCLTASRSPVTTASMSFDSSTDLLSEDLTTVNLLISVSSPAPAIECNLWPRLINILVSPSALTPHYCVCPANS